MLEMREECERCATSLSHDSPARICSFECTFCPECASALHELCPNCGGELVVRPRRGVKAFGSDDAVAGEGPA